MFFVLQIWLELVGALTAAAVFVQALRVRQVFLLVYLPCALLLSPMVLLARALRGPNAPPEEPVADAGTVKQRIARMLQEVGK